MPQPGGAKTKAVDDVIDVWLMPLNVLHYGPVGDGQTNDARSLQRAIDAAHQAGGGTVIVPGGNTLATGTIHLKDNVDLHIERGALDCERQRSRL